MALRKDLPVYPLATHTSREKVQFTYQARHIKNKTRKTRAPCQRFLMSRPLQVISEGQDTHHLPHRCELLVDITLWMSIQKISKVTYPYTYQRLTQQERKSIVHTGKAHQREQGQVQAMPEIPHEQTFSQVLSMVRTLFICPVISKDSSISPLRRATKILSGLPIYILATDTTRENKAYFTYRERHIKKNKPKSRQCLRFHMKRPSQVLSMVRTCHHV